MKRRWKCWNCRVRNDDKDWKDDRKTLCDYCRKPRDRK